MSDRTRPPVPDYDAPLGQMDDAEQESAMFNGLREHIEDTEPEQAASIVEDNSPPLIGHHPFEYLCGTAGVGKTYQARRAAEQIDGCELCATTGIAAINLGEGQTINSLLRYFDSADLKDKFLSSMLQSRLRRLRDSGTRRIVLDEVSMLDAHQLTYLVRAIEEVNEGRTLEDTDDSYSNPDDDQSSGASKGQIGLTLVGDFAQLPPVKASFAFESAEWGKFEKHIIKLDKIYRQTDLEFVEALHAVRKADLRKALDYFTEDRFSPTSDDHFDGSTVFAKNDAVDRYNQLRLDELHTSQISFTKAVWGKEHPDWKKIPQTLIVKEQALVMILANQRLPGVEGEPGALICCNGDLGHVVGKNNMGEVLVTLVRNGRTEAIKHVTREMLEPMEPGRRKELRELGQDAKIRDKKEVVGAVTYMPLRLAWGTTVHKSQGLSLDTVQIDIRDRFFSHPGMLFVALSRARTPGGLRLVGSVRAFANAVTLNPLVKPWL